MLANSNGSSEANVLKPRLGVIVAAFLLVGAFGYAGYAYIQQGKNDLEAIQAEIAQAKFKQTFEDLGLEPGEKISKGFGRFKEETDALNDLLKKLEKDLGKPNLTTDFIGQKKHIQSCSPQQAGFKNTLSWSDVQIAHEPLRQQWQVCRDILHAQEVIYQPAYETGAIAKIPRASILLTWAKSTNQLAQLEVQKGDLIQALYYLNAILEAKNEIGGDRAYTLIEGLVDTAIEAIRIDTLHQILEAPGINYSILAKLQNQIDSPSGLRSYIDSIEGERIIYGEWTWNLIEKSNRAASSMWSGSNEQIDGRHLILGLIYRSTVIDYDHSYYLKCFWMMESSARKVLNGEENYIDQKPSIDNLLNELENVSGLWERFHYFISYLILPSLNSALEKMLFLESLQRQLIISVKLKQYFLEHGSYPENLDPLDLPDHIDLRDPVILENMHYSLNKDGSYRLYGLGLNGIDDGGEYVLQKANDKNTKKIKDRNAPDWLWPKVVTE